MFEAINLKMAWKHPDLSFSKILNDFQNNKLKFKTISKVKNCNKKTLAM